MVPYLWSQIMKKHYLVYLEILKFVEGKTGIMACLINYIGCSVKRRIYFGKGAYSVHFSELNGRKKQFIG